MNMSWVYSMVLMLVVLSVVQALLHTSSVVQFGQHTHAARKNMRLYKTPLELTGKLDPSKKHLVKFVFNGVEKSVEVPEDVSFLETAEKLWRDAPSSCRNGVCTMCAGEVSKYTF